MPRSDVETLIQEASQGMSIVRFIRWADQMEMAGASIVGQRLLPDGSGRTGHKFTLDADRHLFIWRDQTGRCRLWQSEGAPLVEGRAEPAGAR